MKPMNMLETAFLAAQHIMRPAPPQPPANVPLPVTPVHLPDGKREMMDPGAFFAAVRKITGSLDQVQVDVINRMLTAANHWPSSWLGALQSRRLENADILGTSDLHHVGGAFSAGEGDDKIGPPLRKHFRIAYRASGLTMCLPVCWVAFDGNITVLRPAMRKAVSAARRAVNDHFGRAIIKHVRQKIIVVEVATTAHKNALTHSHNPYRHLIEGVLRGCPQ